MQSTTVAAADTITTKSGRNFECVVLQEDARSVTFRIGYGTMTLPCDISMNIKRSPVITESSVAVTTKPTSSGARIPAWSTVVGALVKERWATGLQQIPATVIDKGVMRNVPYQSYRCGEDYEVNVYGDPDARSASTARC